MIDLLRETDAIGLRIARTDEAAWQADDAPPPGLIRIGLHAGGGLPDAGTDAFDILLTDLTGAPPPWVTVPDLAAELRHLREATARQPLAAAILAQVLRVTPMLGFDAALLVESLAYSTLLASGGFRRWRAAMPPPRVRADALPRVRIERTGGVLEIVLDQPRGRNAIDAAMRDALTEALDFARLDPDRAPVVLRGEGAVFSIGGDLAEFGQADDPATAHAIRTLRSPARALHAVRDRATARLHGPCIGAGVEVPAAAGRLTARRGTSFRLPEVAMGLIPGAGGTVTVPRRIGRQRACWFAMSGRAIDLPTALDWGLADAEEA